MKLHLDKDAFRTLILNVAEQTNIRPDILEKDYYVTLLLEELANKQENLPAYFKGGTALYKALGGIRRFSEDIDLTISIDGCSNNQAKTRLENAAKRFSSLPRNKNDAENDNRKGSITSIFNYTSVVDIDVNDSLQRFGRVKIEATSFTVGEPVAPIKIAPIIYDKATEEHRQILISTYDTGSFIIQTMMMERIFVDKIFAAEFYYIRKDYFDVAKHLYDVTVLLQDKRIQAMIVDIVALRKMIDYKRREEGARVGSGLAEKPIKEFSYLKKAIDDDKFIKVFDRMQEIYVFDSEDIIGSNELAIVTEKLKSVAELEIFPEQN